jgi:hypothetical protein
MTHGPAMKKGCDFALILSVPTRTGYIGTVLMIDLYIADYQRQIDSARETASIYEIVTLRGHGTYGKKYLH